MRHLQKLFGASSPFILLDSASWGQQTADVTEIQLGKNIY